MSITSEVMETSNRRDIIRLRMSATYAPTVGGLLRSWRLRRRMSQLMLACQAEISSRQLSFLETGRSSPSREMILHLSEQLNVSLRDRNVMLIAAGYAPYFLRDRSMRPNWRQHGAL